MIASQAILNGAPAACLSVRSCPRSALRCCRGLAARCGWMCLRLGFGRAIGRFGFTGGRAS